MQCPKCSTDKPKVLETRRQQKTIRRIRMCTNTKCNHTWQTLEVILDGKIPRAIKQGKYIVKGDQLSMLIEGF